MISKKIMILVLFLLIFSHLQAELYLSSKDAYQQDEVKGLVYPVKSPKIHPHLQNLIVEGSQEKIKVWVFFRDKGIFSLVQLQKSLDEAEVNLTYRNRRRRLKIRDEGDLVDFKDLQVHRGYITEVINIGVKHRTTSRWLNAISVEMTPQQLSQIAKLSFVRHIKPVASFRRWEPAPSKAPRGPVGDTLNYGPSFDQLEMLNVPAVHELGYCGSGVLICMLDTGFNRTHEALVGVNVIDEWDFINDDGNTAYEPGQDILDQPWHGTVTLSACGGFNEGDLVGPAYGADFILAKTEDVTGETPIEEDYWVEGIEWADSLGVDVASSSLCYSDWYTYPDFNGDSCTITIAADEAAAKGIVVCNAMGNSGPGSGSLLAPADADSIIAVGAVDRDSLIVSFSSRGPTFDGRTKPEVCALGYGTYSADPEDDHGYIYVSGTSLSTPLIAGAVAIIVGARPNWTNMQVREALMMTASRHGTPDNNYGWGIPDVLAALDYFPPGVEDSDKEMSSTFNYLIPNYPNPFSSLTNIEYLLPTTREVNLSVYDIQGRLVQTLVSGKMSAGRHSVTWDRTDRQGYDVSSGVYFYRLSVGNHTETRQMVIFR